MDRVDNDRPESISRPGQGRANGREIRSVVRGKCATDVLQYDQRRASTLLHERFDMAPEPPEGPGALSLEPGPVSSQR